MRSECKELIKEEISIINSQIEKLQPVNVEVDDKMISIHTKLIFCMVDGKICNSQLNVSSQKCYVCGCTPKEMNDKQKLETKIDNPESYQYGLFPLHAKIRTFECLLKISYRLGVKKWQIRKNSEEYKLVDQRKRTIQAEFRKKMGLLVNIVKVGYGTTNDGNTARCFFDNPSESASITGLDETLIKYFSVLLQAISCGYEINPDAFNSYAYKTLERYLELYSWYCMPVTVHKLLVHGYNIIKHAILPIGQLAEDAQECRHKEIKYYRQHNTRKYSRKATMEDLIHTLLFSSDPVVNSYRKKNLKPFKNMSPDLLSLLANPKLSNSISDLESENNQLADDNSSDISSEYCSDTNFSSDST